MQTKFRNPIPTSLYAHDDLLYVHDGSAFQVLAVVGANGRKVPVNASYPKGWIAQTKDMGWTHDRSAIANHIATVVNNYPILQQRCGGLERRRDDLVAKLKLAKAALQRRETLTPAYVTALLQEITVSVEAAEGRVPVSAA